MYQQCLRSATTQTSCPNQISQMEGEFELPEFNSRERVKQQISVPFLWEVKPGAPKRDWVISNPVPSVFACPSPTPTKLVVSVPFQWEEKPGKPLQEASPFHVLPDHAPFSASSCSLNPFVVEGEEEYSLGFDLEAFSFPDNNDTSGAAAWIGGGSNRGDAWYSFSDSEDYSNSSGDTSAQAFQFPRAPSEKSWEVANDDDQLTNPWSPPRSTVTTLEELMMLSRKLRCGQMLPADIRKKSLSSVELIKKFLIVCS
ncbi:uncharacterized protein LOC133917019 [Phragmites australis]|uniref:uncharacterized protein LOC133917019 n=1 Tax=Phragmites australis TaxID=29695 RepID=UPI002D77DBCC|nr:uncharacterized protein LOC133917019 [Phragmites australis]